MCKGTAISADTHNDGSLALRHAGSEPATVEVSALSPSVDSSLSLAATNSVAVMVTLTALDGLPSVVTRNAYTPVVAAVTAVAVKCDESTNVNGTVTPLTVTVLNAVKPVPTIAYVVATFTTAVVGVTDVSVGAGVPPSQSEGGYDAS